MSQAAPESPAEQQPADEQQGSHVGPVAAALVAGGATAALLAPAAAGAAAVLYPPAKALSTANIDALVAATLLRYRRFAQGRAGEVAATLTERTAGAYPEQPEQVRKAAVDEEVVREREFQRRQQDRLQIALAKALAIPEPDKRRAATEKALDTELRYLKQREEAAGDRALANVEYQALKETSPLGAFWRLDPGVKVHTPGCLLLANRFWPHEILEKARPPLHAGCPCRLVPAEEAIALGLMPRHATKVNVADAWYRARKAMKAEKLVHETIGVEEWEAYVEELWAEADLAEVFPDRDLSEQALGRGGKPVTYTEKLHPRARGGKWRKGVGAAAGEKPPLTAVPAAPGFPPVVDWVSPPPPKGKKGERKAGGFSATGETNTKVGDLAEQVIGQLQMQSLLPPGKRQNPLDAKWDSSDWGFEVKAVTTAATKYAISMRPEDVQKKLDYAQQNKLKPAMMMVVLDADAGTAHCYWREGIGQFHLNRKWNHMGVVQMSQEEAGA